MKGATKPPPVEIPHDALLLAAVDRAAHNKPRTGQAVLLGDVIAHLALPEGLRTTRRLVPRLEALRLAGRLALEERHGSKVWALTSSGRRSLSAARRQGRLGALPESPGHKKWREARETASDSIDGLKQQLSETLAEATELLKAHTPAKSEALFELSDRLQHACRGYATAAYDLTESIEPDDAVRQNSRRLPPDSPSALAADGVQP